MNHDTLQATIILSSEGLTPNSNVLNELKLHLDRTNFNLYLDFKLKDLRERF